MIGLHQGIRMSEKYMIHRIKDRYCVPLQATRPNTGMEDDYFTESWLFLSLSLFAFQDQSAFNWRIYDNYIGTQNIRSLCESVLKSRTMY
jgi:hypothetical protein